MSVMSAFYRPTCWAGFCSAISFKQQSKGNACHTTRINDSDSYAIRLFSCSLLVPAIRKDQLYSLVWPNPRSNQHLPHSLEINMFTMTPTKRLKETGDYWDMYIDCLKSNQDLKKTHQHT
jgi:hypothetical protein